MTKSINLLFLLLLLSSFTAVAQSDENPSQSEFGKDFMATWERAQSYTLELAELMPEDKYDYKPVEDVMSFREHLLHLVGNLYSLNSRFVKGEKAPFPEFDKETVSKAEIKEILQGAFDYVTATLKEASDEEMNAVSEKFWSKGTKKYGVMLLMRDHMTHHRGQLVIYLRMNGVKPPRYRGW